MKPILKIHDFPISSISSTHNSSVFNSDGGRLSTFRLKMRKREMEVVFDLFSYAADVSPRKTSWGGVTSSSADA